VIDDRNENRGGNQGTYKHTSPFISGYRIREEDNEKDQRRMGWV
jgi:hypothetical protein